MKKYFWLFAGLSLITVCNFSLLKLFSQKENPEQSITALQQPSVYSVQLPESLSFCGERKSAAQSFYGTRKVRSGANFQHFFPFFHHFASEKVKPVVFGN